MQWAARWIQQKFAQEPQLFHRYFWEVPHDGRVYHTIYGSYNLRLLPADRQGASGKIVGADLAIRYPRHWGESDKGEALPNLISRVFARAFKPAFDDRVAEVNQQCFGFSYRDISYKYNTSNWGSCSTRGRLNFSTRLFLTTRAAVDYVIVHELAHLQVPNHSAKFWAVVEAAMPTYREQEQWLKEHGHLLYF